MPNSRRFRTLCAVSCLGLSAAAQADETITFDGIADGTDISNYYALFPGVTMTNPLGGGVYARSSLFNSSPDNVVSIFQTGVPAFNAYSGAVDITIRDPIFSVSVDAAAVASLEPLGTPMNRPYMEAWNRAGTYLGRTLFSGALPTTSLGVTPFETLHFDVACPTVCSVDSAIGKIRLSSQQSLSGPPIYALFDNFVLSPVPEPDTWAMMLAGMGLVGFVALRRRT